ncbi:MAG TPA: hypothetical protein VJ204_02755 [Solirubrobacterales bacterium]|nr:hypothetical protein [Solirubrobacterales bacterium]
MVLLAGCGGGAHQPEEEIAKASQRVEKAQGDLLLAEVEYARAQFREAPEEFAGKAAKIAKVRRGDVKEAHELQTECHEGDGLESCQSIEAIEHAVDELDQEAAGG